MPHSIAFSSNIRQWEQARSMEFSVKSGHPEKQRTACLVLGVFEGRKLSENAEELDAACNQFISNLLRRGDIEGKLGQSLMLYEVPGSLADRVLLIGCGKSTDLNENRFKTIIKNMTKKLNELGAMDATSYLAQLPVKGRNISQKLRFSIESIYFENYQFNHYKSKQDEVRRPLKRLTFAIESKADLAATEAALNEAIIISEGIDKARDLGNLPGNICTPTYLAKTAEDIAANHSTVSAQILGEAELTEMEMNCLLAVGRGSTEETKLICLQYQGTDKDSAPYAIVGKGISFDTGGLCIKPRTNMCDMKMDMCGAASVIATFEAVAKLQLPINLVMVVASAENMPDGNAYRPGDIIKSKSGLMVEVVDTDAEGRVALSDALTFVEQFKPETVIDVATLTGAVIVALGHHMTGVMGNHNPLINDIISAGKTAHDECWQLPLTDLYQEQADSKIADVANLGKGGASSITAAAFLSRFAKKYNWAHLDIAGTAMRDFGASGRPVSLLVQYLIDRSAA